MPKRASKNRVQISVSFDPGLYYLFSSVIKHEGLMIAPTLSDFIMDYLAHLKAHNPTTFRAIVEALKQERPEFTDNIDTIVRRLTLKS